ncbi:hypothetical protein [Coleofasciculus sp. FACHB-1120]|uniref:hypothetical protein n=1 Tax=Coleofasciculus sp. FACHB-1120 TaxID=2692783 RepID=UPI001681E20C|nr:hypothetical protein [Coleofasciculus sp. FACHB-1120]MBD2743120.1 hypothetical protein [Coleofasciculus sp. FACHB-1120]
MGLAQTQQILAKLYTNTLLRERFFANPQAVGEEFGLSSDESQHLAKLSAQQVNLFASSLKRKRLGEVRELLPLTQRVLGKSFAELFWRYAETHVPGGIKKHLEDAIAFATFIENNAQLKEIEPPWVVDLARYEKSWLLAAEPTFRLTMCRFRYAIDKLARMTQQEVEPLLLLQPTIVFWFRLSARSQLRHIVISLPNWQ